MSKQLVMDGGGPGKIIKSWLWQCDNCPTKEISEEPPTDWFVGATRHLCYNCTDLE